MLKKIIIISLIVCLGGIVVLTFFFLKKQQVKQDFQSIKAVPINSFCIVTINNIPQFFKSTLSDNQMWQNISGLPTIMSLNNGIKEIESICGKKILQTGLLDNKTMHISMHFTGNSDFNFLFTVGLETESNSDKFMDELTSSINNNFDIKNYVYDNISVYNITSKTDPLKHYYLASISNMFIISKSKMLVQSSIGQIIANESLLKDESFKLVYNSSDREKVANIYINYKTLPKFLSFYASSQYYKTIAQTSKMANWAELDLTLKNNEILLNGYITTDSLSDNFFHLFSDQEPVNFDISEIIPSSASLIISLGVSNSEIYKQTYTDCLRKDGSYAEHKRNIMEIDSVCNDDVEKILYDIIENEMCLVMTGNSAQLMKENAYVVINTKSRRLAEEKLIGLLDSYSQNNKIPFNTLKSELKIDNDIVYPMYRMPLSGIPTQVFGKFFSWSDANYFTFIENYLIMGNSVSSLSEFIKSYLLNKTLKTDRKFETFTQNLPEQYNFLFYSKVPHCIDFFKEFLTDDFKKTLDDNFGIFAKHQALAYQLSSSKGKLYNTVYTTYNIEGDQTSQSLWESHLDTTVFSRPTFVYNCATHENDILVQDNQMKLYLINKNGKIMWEKILTEKINSEIFGIDYFKNGKIQYVFSSQNYLYIIDRLGKFVSPFPMRLPVASTAGLCVTDIENKHDYRFYIPAQNNQIFCFTQDGKAAKEWTFGKTDNLVKKPIKNFTIHGKSLIVFFDKYTVYIVDKKGNKAINLKETIEPGNNTEWFFDNVSNSLVITNNKGQIKKIETNGTVKTITPESFSNSHYFAANDLNGDGINEFIFTDDDRIVGYTSQGVKLFSYSCNDKITDPPVFLKNMNGTTVFGVLCRSENKLYMFKPNGQPMSGFPINGQTSFSIGKFKSENNSTTILIGNNDNFLYNYEIK